MPLNGRCGFLVQQKGKSTHQSHFRLANDTFRRRKRYIQTSETICFDFSSNHVKYPITKDEGSSPSSFL